MARIVVRHIIFWVIAIATLTACKTRYNTAQTRHVSAIPSLSILHPNKDNVASLDVTFCIPPHYLNNRSRLVIVPELWIKDSLYQSCTPVVVNAPIYEKKRHRKQALENQIDRLADYDTLMTSVGKGMEVPYRELIQLPHNAENAKITATLTTDGCGECTGFDTITLAMTSSHIPLISQEPFLWSSSTFVVRPKIASGKGVARLQFIINKWNIVPDLGNNQAELDSMLHKLAPIINDSLATIQSITITGLASADGSIRFNTALASKRAHSAFSWLKDTLQLTNDLAKRIKINSRPEGWQPVVDAMKKAGNENARLVQEILTKYGDKDDDVQERHIRRLPCWKEIRDNYLQKDRNVEYTYSYIIRSFTTDRELLSMYYLRPEAFNEEELLRVAELMPKEIRRQVYEYMLKRFPKNAIASNNLAVILLEEDSHDKAEHCLTGISTNEAKYNLGLLYAKQKRLDEAWTLLRDTSTFASAIVAMELQYNEDATEILKSLDKTSPRVCYAYALLASRENRKEECAEWLKKAIRDEELKRRAENEPEFIKIGLKQK